MIKWKLLFFLILVSSLATADQREIPYFEKKEFTPYWPNETKGYTPAKVESFKAVKQDEKILTPDEFKGQISLINFFFVQCPNICPLMMKNVQHLQKSLGSAKKDVHIYSFSVLPNQDTPERLRSYAKTYKIDLRDWTLLTGDQKEIYRVGKHMFKADGAVGEQKSEDNFIHTQNIYLVDHELNIRGIYDTNSTKDMGQLKTDIEILKSTMNPKVAER